MNMAVTGVIAEAGRSLHPKVRPWPRICAPALTDEAWKHVERYAEDWRRNNRTLFFEDLPGMTIRGAVVIAVQAGESNETYHWPSNVRFAHVIWLDGAGLIQQKSVLLPDDVRPLDENFADTLVKAIRNTPKSAPAELMRGDAQAALFSYTWLGNTIGSAIRTGAQRHNFGPTVSNLLNALPENIRLRPDWEPFLTENRMIAQAKLDSFEDSEPYQQQMTGSLSDAEIAKISRRHMMLKSDVNRYSDMYGTLPYYMEMRLIGAMAKAGQAQFRKLLSRVDKFTIKTVAKARLYDFNTLNWVLAADGNRRRNRAQAMVEYPAMMDILKILSDGIDGGEDPAGLLADFFGCKTAVMRRFRHWLPDSFRGPDLRQRLPEEVFSPQQFYREDPDHEPERLAILKHILQTFDHLPPEWFPKDTAEIEAVFSVLYLHDCRDMTPDQQAVWLKRARRHHKFQRVSREIHDTFNALERSFLNPMAWRLMEEDSPGAVEKAFFQGGLLPWWHSSSLRPLSAAVVLGERGISWWSQISQDHHNRIADIQRTYSLLPRLLSQTDGKSDNVVSLVPWPVPESWTDPKSGLQIVPLDTPEALGKEGMEMDHCVADYIPSCLSGESLIFSLRSNTGRSTAELVWARTGGLLLAQHKGLSNDPPPDGHPESLDRYLRVLTAKAPKLWERVKVQRERARACQHHFYNPPLPFDPRHDDSCIAVFELWRFALPKGQRDMTWRDWMESGGLRAAMEKRPSREGY